METWLRKWLVIGFVLLPPLGLVVFLATASIALSRLSSEIAMGSRWALTTALPRTQGLARHAAVAYDGKIFVIGGSTDSLDDLSPTIYTATLQPGGEIGGWNTYTSGTLPAVAFPGAAVNKEGCVYITGGYNGNPLPSTYFGKPDEKVWSGPTKQEFRKRYLHASVISGNKIFVLGGWDYLDKTQPILSDDRYALMAPNCGGLASNWLEATSVSLPRAALAAVEFEGKIYAIGGLRPNPHDRYNPKASNSVYLARVTDTGLAGWSLLTSTLPISLAYHSAVMSEVERKIYVFGGQTDTGEISYQVFSARIMPDGTLMGSNNNPTQWQEESTLSDPTLRLYRHSAVNGGNGSIYVIGGQDSNGLSHIDVHYNPSLTFTKSADPPGPVHEGDVITYTLSYANTSLITQTITITDILSFNLMLLPDSVTPTLTRREDSALVWELGDKSPGASGEVSFRAQVPLLPPVGQNKISAACPPEPTPTPPPGHILPVPVACGTTRFWANGVTYQSASPPDSYTVDIQIPPGTNPTALWLLMKGIDNTPPTVEGQPARLLKTSHDRFGASLWTADISPTMTADDQLTVVTDNPRQLNAVYLFDKNDPPFDESALSDFQNERKTLTYTFEIPTVETQTLDAIVPFMDVTYWTDDLQPNPYLTTVTVRFGDQPVQTVVANMPNMGNGLLMTQFPFAIGPLGTDIATATKVLTVTVDTQDDIYTLGPRVCRPVRIENTAWLCSQQAGCISSTVTNAPPRPMTEGIYLPIILKAYP
jgi:uncharacterized repeat protein (TIGR01451 family)